jgi:cathepsin L
MMLFTLLVIVAAASAHDQAWEDYKLEFDKHYTAEEETTRYANWKKVVAEVGLHNAMYGSEFTQAVNELSDLTDEEYDRIYLSGLRVPEGPSNATMYVPTNDPIPNSVDWRSKGMVTGVKNQGQCGSCYSFSATGAHEGQWMKAKGSLPSLSEQQCVDCSGRYGNYGCRGGWYQNCWKYIRDAGGVEGESSYRYTARQGRCAFNRGSVVATCTGYHDTQPGSESDLTNALSSVGPVSVAIDASASTFRSYRSGVHYSRSCSSYRLNHAVLAVGYGSEGNQDYFLVKNSWGTRWGAGGYIKMARNRGNNCGIATKPSYPIV